MTPTTFSGLVVLSSFLLVIVIGSTQAEVMMMGDAESMSDMGGGNDGSGNPGCGNCGAECAKKCGTRLFRPCCFHFVRKRNPLLFFNLAKQHKFNPRAIQKELNDILSNTPSSSYDTETYPL